MGRRQRARAACGGAWTDLIKALVCDWHEAVARSGWLAARYLRAISALRCHPPFGPQIRSYGYVELRIKSAAVKGK